MDNRDINKYNEMRLMLRNIGSGEFDKENIDTIKAIAWECARGTVPLEPLAEIEE